MNQTEFAEFSRIYAACLEMVPSFRVYSGPPGTVPGAELGTGYAMTWIAVHEGKPYGLNSHFAQHRELMLIALETLRQITGAGKFAIEFRSGSHYQTEFVHVGGPALTAKRFRTRADAEDFMRANEWILLNGGMVVKVEES